VYRSSDDQTPETTGQTPEIAALAAAPPSAALAAAPPSAALAAERLAELTLTYKITASPFGDFPTQSPMLSANIKHTCYWFAVLHMFEFGKRTRLLRVMKEKVVDVLNAYFKKLSPDEKKKVRGDDWNDGEAYKVIEAVLEVAAIPGMRYNDMQRREISPDFVLPSGVTSFDLDVQFDLIHDIVYDREKKMTMFDWMKQFGDMECGLLHISSNLGAHFLLFQIDKKNEDVLFHDTCYPVTQKWKKFHVVNDLTNIEYCIHFETEDPLDLVKKKLRVKLSQLEEGKETRSRKKSDVQVRQLIDISSNVNPLPKHSVVTEFRNFSVLSGHLYGVHKTSSGEHCLDTNNNRIESQQIILLPVNNGTRLS
jgi:hypothetical protein